MGCSYSRTGLPRTHYSYIRRRERLWMSWPGCNDLGRIWTDILRSREGCASSWSRRNCLRNRGMRFKGQRPPQAAARIQSSEAYRTCCCDQRALASALICIYWGIRSAGRLPQHHMLPATGDWHSGAASLPTLSRVARRSWRRRPVTRRSRPTEVKHLLRGNRRSARKAPDGRPAGQSHSAGAARP